MKKIEDLFKSHWLGWTIIVGAATFGTTWFLANELLVKPRDFEISRLKSGVVDKGDVRIEINIADKSIIAKDLPVKGRVSEPNANVFLLAQPANSKTYWVISHARVSSDGSWIAEPVSSIPKDLYQILAVANPKTDLAVGDKLDSLPAATGFSNTVTVLSK